MSSPTTDANDGPSDPSNLDSSSSDPSLVIVVKNPTDHPGAQPFNVTISSSATILQLKERLSVSYPDHPAVASQRLIYAGKLLQNADLLSIIIPDHSVTHTMHIVVSNQNASASSSHPASSSTMPGNIPPTSAAGAPQPPQPPGVPPGNLPPQFAHMPHPYMTYPFAPDANFPPPPTDGPIPPEEQPEQATYRAHLQTMERLIAESWQTHLNAAAAAAAANLNVENANLAGQLRAQAAELDAHAAALHMQAHAHARAQAVNGVPQAALDAPAPNQMQQAQMQAEEAMAQARMMVANAQARARAEVEAYRNPWIMAGAPNAPRQPNAGVAFDWRMGRMRNDGNAQQNDPRIRHFFFQFQFNWALLLKLAVFVYILGYDATPQRMYIMVATALASYMWVMGHFRFLRRIVGAALPNPRQLIEDMFPPTPQESDATPQDGSSATTGRQVRAPHRFGRIAVILSFMYSFVYGFICSLLPAWNPEPHARLDELMVPWDNAQEAQDAPQPNAPDNDAAHGADDQNGLDHEHAD